LLGQSEVLAQNAAGADDDRRRIRRSELVPIEVHPQVVAPHRQGPRVVPARVGPELGDHVGRRQGRGGPTVAGTEQRICKRHDLRIGHGQPAASDLTADRPVRDSLQAVASVHDGGDVAVPDRQITRHGSTGARPECDVRGASEQRTQRGRAKDHDPNPVGIEGRRSGRGVDVAVGDAARGALARIGHEVAGDRRVADVGGDQGLADAIARMEDLLAERAQEVAKEEIDGGPARVGDGRLHANGRLRRFENVVRGDRDGLIGVVESRREREAEVPHHGARVDPVEQVVHARSPDDCGVAIATVVQDDDARVVGGVLEVDHEGPLLEEVPARLAGGPHQIHVDQVAAELAHATREVPLGRLHDRANPGVLEDEVADPASGERALDQLAGRGDHSRVRRGARDASHAAHVRAAVIDEIAVHGKAVGLVGGETGAAGGR